MRLTREQIEFMRAGFRCFSTDAEQRHRLDALCDLAVLGLAQEDQAQKIVSYAITLLEANESPEMMIAYLRAVDERLNTASCHNAAGQLRSTTASPVSDSPTSAPAAPDAAPPALQMALGNHSIGVFKDGKLIAADREVYAEPAAAAPVDRIAEQERTHFRTECAYPNCMVAGRCSVGCDGIDA